MSASFALVGVSGFGHIHYENIMALARTGAVDLSAAVVINPEEVPEKVRALKAIGCQIHADYREMLDAWRDRIDLCVLPTGIHDHAPMTIAALEAGCNVLVEKPAAGAIQDLEAMLDAERRSGRFVAVGFQHIYTRETSIVKAAIADGAIGKMKSIRCMAHWPRPDSYFGRNNWAGRFQCGGRWVLDAPFNNAFAHSVNLACFLAGSHPRESAAPIFVEAELYRTRQIETSDTACLRVTLESDIPASFWFNHSCKERTGPLFEIRGDKGTLRWSNDQILLCRQGTESPLATVSSPGDCQKQMWDAVLSRLRAPDIFVCGLGIARSQALCASAAFAASPISEIDSTHLYRTGPESDPITAIEDVEAICAEAFQANELWAEMNVPWAQAGDGISTANFRRFDGPFQLLS